MGRVHRAGRRGTGGVSVVPVDQVFRGEVLLVGSGEAVPVDGRLMTVVSGVLP